MQHIVVTVNGTELSDGQVAARTTTLDWLRARGLTGAKEGCAEGECGACSVLVATPADDGGTAWTAVNACLLPVAALDGQEVVTAEGLGTPEAPHPVQAALAADGGSQCGYCTPGFACSMAAEFYRAGRDGEAMTDAAASARPEHPEHDHDGHHGPNGLDLHALAGNLCRCTGYGRIVEAVRLVAERRSLT
jgi:xanthine dehydrogenase small subunit